MGGRFALRNCKKASEKIFHSDQEISKPTILIRAEFETHDRFLRFTRLKQLLPITSPISMKIYFKNLYHEEIKGIKGVAFNIYYPGKQQMRPSRIDLPGLKASGKYGDCVYSETRTLFHPEIPGTHRLTIENSIDNRKYMQFADFHGVTDRPFKLIGGDWTCSFHVSSEMEYRLYLTAFGALAVSLLSLLISIIIGICT